MEILYDHYTQSDKSLTAFFTLTDTEAFKWHADIPDMPEADIQAYLEANIEKYRIGIFRKMYRKAVITPVEDQSDLDAWLIWIDNGCQNAPDSIIAATPWKHTWN